MREGITTENDIRCNEGKVLIPVKEREKVFQKEEKFCQEIRRDEADFAGTNDLKNSQK